MNIRRYAIAGALLGVGVALLGTLFQVVLDPAAGTSADKLVRAQSIPAMWILDGAPFFLALFGTIAGRRQDDVVSLEARNREALARIAAELFGAAGKLLTTVSAFGSAHAQTTASVQETIATLQRMANAATQATLSAETVVGRLAAAEAGARRAEQGAGGVSGEGVQRLAQDLGETSRAARDIAQVAQQQDRSIDQVLNALNEIYLASENSMASTAQVAGEAQALNDLAGHLQKTVLQMEDARA